MECRGERVGRKQISFRLVEPEHDEKPRLERGRIPDKSMRHRIRIPPSAGLWNLRSACFSCHEISSYACAVFKSAAHRGHQHFRKGLCGARGNNPTFRNRMHDSLIAGVVNYALHDVGAHQDPAVGKSGNGRRHLQGGHRNPLAERRGCKINLAARVRIQI